MVVICVCFRVLQIYYLMAHVIRCKSSTVFCVFAHYCLTFDILDSTYVIKFCSQQVYFGASVTKFYLAFDMLGISCFTGMSYLVRRTHLDDVKGLSYFGRFLAEDFFLAKYLHER